ncbi:MAG TPA: cytochrome c3 family protein [Vicinamibacterales bacterium]|nr:cytochrome c3 family protein [Vicinamibacterales bacterium]
MRILHRSLILAAFVLLAVAAEAFAQGSRCADCHIANAPSALPNWTGFALRHLQDYDSSAHRRANIGCDRCHGGNPNTFEKFLAHKDMLPPSSPASPANKVNLPNTCGTCHTGPFVAFQKSHHIKLLQTGDDRGPTCSTCHGEVAANLLSPTALGKQCAQCHAEGKPEARPGRADDARLLMTEIKDVRERLKEAQSIIRRIKNREERAKFEEQYRQAEVPIIEAANAGHEFVFDNLKERLERARQRTERLIDALANQR